MNNSSPSKLLFYSGKENQDGRSVCSCPTTNNPTSESLHAIVVKQPLYAGFDYYPLLLYCDQSLNIILPPKSRPISTFPQVIFKVGELRVAKNCPSLILIHKNSRLAANVTLTFQDINGLLPPIDMHFTANKPLPESIREVINDALDDVTWGEKMKEIDGMNGMPLDSYHFFIMKGSKRKEIYPKMKPIDFVRSNFNSDLSLYRPSSSLYYQVMTTCDGIMNDQELFEIVTKLNTSSMEHFLDSLVEIIESCVGNDLEKKGKIELAEKIVTDVAILTMTGILSKIWEQRYNVRNWEEVCKLFDGITKNLSKSEGLRDFNQSSLALIRYIFQKEEIISRFIELYISINKALTDTRNDEFNTVFGRILFSSVVIVAEAPYTLIVTTGFFKLMDITPNMTTSHEILPLSFYFKRNRDNPLLFNQSITCMQVFPMSKSSAIVITRSGTFNINFKSEKALLDLLLILAIRRRSLHTKSFVPVLPRHGTAEITLEFTPFEKGYHIIIETNLMGHNWVKQMKLSSLMKNLRTIASNSHLVCIPNIENHIIPPHLLVPITNEFLGMVINSQKISDEIVGTFPEAEEQSFHFAKSFIIDSISTLNLEASYLSLKTLGVASFVKALELHQPPILRVLAESFPEQFKEESLLNQSLLSFASEYISDLQIIREMLRSLDPNEKCNDILKAPLNASVKNKGGTMQVILDSIDTNDHEDTKRLSPLIVALSENLYDKTHELLRKETNIINASNELRSALQYIIAVNNIEALKVIAPFLGHAVNAPSVNGEFAIHTCILCKNCNALSTLIRYCPDLNPNYCNSQFESPIHFIINQANSEDLLKMLLEHPALELNIYNFEGKTPLIKAIELCRYDLIKIMVVDIRCNVNFPDLKGYMPIHIAATLNNCEMISVLLENGSNIDMPTTTGQTCLSIAVSQNNIEIVRFLINHQAKSRLWYYQGNLPEHYASSVIASELRTENQDVMYQLLDNFSPSTLAFK